MEIKFFQKTIFNMQTTSREFLSDQEKFKKTKNFGSNELKNNRPINDNEKNEISVDENLKKSDKSQSEVV